MIAFEVFLIVILVGDFAGVVHSQTVDLQTQNELWAKKISTRILGFTNKITGVQQVNENYKKLNLTVQKESGKELVNELSKQLEKFFGGKVNALRDLAKEAARAENEFRDVDQDDHFYNGKYLKGMDLKYDPTFRVPVNFSASIVHIPTEVFDKDPKVARDIKWTKSLNSVFERNFKKYPGLSWQYFGSAEGIHRQYPGREWPLPHDSTPDLYDARRRPWYIQGASSPKDVVVLIDISGSLQGIRIEIARRAAEVIIETLTTNDFFHVITFNNESKLICCEYEEYLMQATRGNKEYVKGFLRVMEATNTANWTAGTEMALKLLNKTSFDKEGSGCQQAIIILSDGSASYEKEVFKRYDPYKKIRVFTYVVGPKQYGTQEMKTMACNHKGFYSRTAILGAVWKTVTSYMRVLSRPVVFTEEKPVSFTSVFVDATGSGLVSTGSIPVFKISNSELLGIMATDIPVKDLSEYIFYPLIGPNGYVFVIDNNGLILIHPGINEKKLGNLSPQPNMDIDELEFAVHNQSVVHEMRSDLILADSGNVSFKAYIKSEDELRIRQDNMQYFYMRSKTSLFSIGISSPDFGFIVTSPKIPFDEGVKYLENVTRLKRWPYCSKMRNVENLIEALIKKLKGDKREEIRDCQMEMIDGMLLDAVATNDLTEIWKKNDAEMRNNQILNVHARSHWGVIRSYSLNNQSLPNSELISKKKEVDLSVSPWGFYGRSVRRPNKLTISVLLRDETPKWKEYVPYISIHQPAKSKSQNVINAVLGMEMNYTTFSERFFIDATTDACTGNDTSKTCMSCSRKQKNQMQGLYCYILDENAFIVASNEPQDIGRFFGEVDSKIMAKIIEENKPYSLYKAVVLLDYQASCKLYVGGKKSNANPLFRGVTSMIFSFASLIQAALTLASKMILHSLWSMMWGNAPVEMSNSDEMTNVSCVKNTTIYLANDTSKAFSANARCSDKDNCIRKFSVSPIPDTNLYLLTVVARDCGKCKGWTLGDLPGVPGKVEDIVFYDTAYSKPPKRENVRRHLDQCYGPSNENNDRCGNAVLATHSYALVAFCYVLLCFLMREQ